MKQSQRSFSSAGMIDMTARNELTQNLGWNIMVGPTKWLFNSFMRLFLDVIFHSPPDVLVCFGFHFFWGGMFGKPTSGRANASYLLIVGPKVERVSCFLCKPSDAPKWPQDP